MKHLTLLSVLVASLALLGAIPLEARYIPTPLEDLLGSSDLVAVGVVSEVREAAYVFRLEETLVGAPTAGSTVRIQRFHDWPCSMRWQPYAVGQRLLVMVRAVVHENYDYMQNSGGWESEFPIFEEQVLVHGYAVPGTETVSLSKNYDVPAVPLEVIAEATEDLHRCWEIHDGSIEARCTAEEIGELVRKSSFHLRLLKDLPRPKSWGM